MFATGGESDQVDEIDVALTPAAGAIAESGSIIMTDESSPDRLSESAPWIHIAVVRRDTIHRSIADAIAAMPEGPNIIWVTGPSKTADVEGILIQGVHSPACRAACWSDATRECVFAPGCNYSDFPKHQPPNGDYPALN